MLIENEDKRFFPLFDDHLTLPQKFPCHNKLFSQYYFITDDDRIIIIVINFDI